MNTPQPLQLPTHEEIEDARTEARIEAQEEYEDQQDALNE